jgi:hypothetical protein
MNHRILYIGSLTSGETSLNRFRALERLQQHVIPFDLTRYAYKSGKMNAILGRFPIGPLIAKVNADLVTAAQKEKPGSSGLTSRSCLRRLRSGE